MTIESGCGFVFQWDIPLSCRHVTAVLWHFSASIIKQTSDELRYPNTFIHIKAYILAKDIKSLILKTHVPNQGEPQSISNFRPIPSTSIYIAESSRSLGSPWHSFFALFNTLIFYTPHLLSEQLWNLQTLSYGSTTSVYFTFTKTVRDDSNWSERQGPTIYFGNCRFLQSSKRCHASCGKINSPNCFYTKFYKA